LVYRALNEYLLSLRQPVRIQPIHVILPIFVSLIFLFFEATRVMAPLFVLLTIVVMALSAAATKERKRIVLAASGELEHREWKKLLIRFTESKQLEDRSHPALIDDLEACAKLRRRVLDSLEGTEWSRLSLQPGWRDVREVCRSTAEDLLNDALWASRGAFRPIGARRETFKRRCQDPAFAYASLGAVKLARAQLERLYDEVSHDPFAAIGVRDALERAQGELKAIRDAEEEVRALS
jgi:hypothetical protein